MKKIIPTLFALLLTATSAFSASILDFDFSGSTANAAYNTQASTFAASGLLASSMTRGTLISANNAANSFRGTGFSNDGISLANNDYFQFSVTGSGGSLASVTAITANFGGTGTFFAGSGVTMAYAYSLDGGASFTLAPTFTVTATGSSTYTFVGADLAALTDASSVVFKLFASGQTTTGGWGLQSAAGVGTIGLSVIGSVTPSAVPEPSTYALIAGGVVLAGVIVHRRRKASAAV